MVLYFENVGNKVSGKKESGNQESEKKYQEKRYHFQTRQYKIIVYDKRNQLVYITVYWYTYAYYTQRQ